MPRVPLCPPIGIVILTVLVTGCDEDPRIVQLSREAAERQARQSQQMAQLSRQTAEGAKLLVESDAQSRKELIVAQQNLHAQQAEIGRQRDQLEAERKEIANERRWDSIVGQAIISTGVLLACLLPLLLAWQLLRTVHHENPDGELTGMLIAELASPDPRLLPPASLPPPVLDARSAPARALPCAAESEFEEDPAG